ncbi:outer membrane beta-barrel protein [Hymenobacter sp. BT635]|uniref:Outer membrane beta-barrel protein n=1 Tax=Hymenobacter nitidus TaxID=2880929 RepID=A0ABS8AJX6_9BACT|nr:outer membrane beta-barrel protein [Hymenobacter nitidus]MCB2380196.1 outer membrane beta-barrel protein [Hymenobacter nitidus]
MKKIFLLALLAAGTEAVHAQSIAAGTISLGGTIGYSKSTDKTSSSFQGQNYSYETKSSEFRFSPSVGYFLNDNLALGLSLGYSSERRPYTTSSPSPNNPSREELDPTRTIQVGPYVQYYKMLSEQFGVVGTLGGGYQSLKRYDYINNGPMGGIQISEQKASGFYAGLTPGIIFFPVPKLGISASIGGLGYDRLNYDYPTNTGGSAPSDFEASSSVFGANFGLDQLQFGGTFYLGR